MALLFSKQVSAEHLLFLHLRLRLCKENQRDVKLMTSCRFKVDSLFDPTFVFISLSPSNSFIPSSLNTTRSQNLSWTNSNLCLTFLHSPTITAYASMSLMRLVNVLFLNQKNNYDSILCLWCLTRILANGNTQ